MPALRDCLRDQRERSRVGRRVPGLDVDLLAGLAADAGGDRRVIDQPVDAAERRAGGVLRGCRALEIRGFARVDFLLERGSGRLMLNEINTLPGFTSISMFPK